MCGSGRIHATWLVKQATAGSAVVPFPTAGTLLSTYRAVAFILRPAHPAILCTPTPASAAALPNQIWPAPSPNQLAKGSLSLGFPSLRSRRAPPIDGARYGAPRPVGSCAFVINFHRPRSSLTAVDIVNSGGESRPRICRHPRRSFESGPCARGAPKIDNSLQNPSPGHRVARRQAAVSFRRQAFSRGNC